MTTRSSWIGPSDSSWWAGYCSPSQPAWGSGFAWLLAVPYEVGDNKCEAVLFAEHRWQNCEDARPWWEMLAILGASVPVAIVGTALCVAGHTNLAISRHWRSAASLEAEAAKDKSTRED
ncbi:hypothetical protein LRS74_00455 [Streptomyces sp. LX-29]|uniref:hypothetical protein n=1 Tax=Streptomyces sp. LX-29 TaxID=2900152 RepID=UPI00240D21E7|nr:hypothetical protein [Streptomyces sp. LX-29]WFB05653.1 hypothetical protein LRS74_00455 [Streptomyces sp. LX-29]